MNRDIATQGLEVLTLTLGGQVFAIEAAHVREILDLVAVTEVPTADPFVGGLINVRGKVVPLADLRHRFDMARPEPSVDTRIIVLEVELADEAMTVALIADKVHEVTEIAASALEETPRIGLRWRQDYIRCIAKRDGEFIVVLDIAAIFSVETRRSDRPDDRSKASNAA